MSTRSKNEIRSLRLLRCVATALACVVIYLKRNLANIDGIIFSTMMMQPVSAMEHKEGNKLLLQERVRELAQLPESSVHRVAFVTFSYVKPNDANKLFNFILPAVDTWAVPVASTNNVTEPSSLYVVFSQLSREPFEKFCVHKKGKLTTKQYSLCQHIRPIYVDCPEGKFGDSPCCKQQEGLLELFQNHNYPLYDWYAFFDDDVYLRKEYIAELLPAMQHNPNFPMAAIPYSQNSKIIGFDNRSCNQREKTTKKDKHQFTYPWGQPIFYSRGAVSMMARGYRANSLLEQCMAFDVTHDVGNALLNWMYSLPVGRLPPLHPLPNFRNDFIGSHWVGREDMRESTFGQERIDRVGQVIKALPAGEFSFYKTHERWLLHENRPPDVHGLGLVRNEEQRFYPNVTGFRKTGTYAQHGDPQYWEEGLWHTMTIRDCNV